MQKERVQFGFKTVEAEEKASLVGEVFSSVADKYDIMNDLMSFGLHRLWKDRFVAMIQPSEGAKLLDLAGGTGDIAFRIWEKARGKGIALTVSDIDPEMLEQGKGRALDRGIAEIRWEEADAEQLPFEDGCFDVVTIAFGIRNVTHIDKALAEVHRVLRPGGRFLCLEFSNVDNDVLKQFYDQYSFKVIPLVGQAVTGNRDAYQYLVESIRQFPTREAFAEMLKQAGFEQVKATPLSGGVVAIHSGWRV